MRHRWAALSFDERRQLVHAAAEVATAVAASDLDLSALLTRENGKLTVR
jgi:acyl-CoA reductase-like NAD-dependent aldehyde dehydrogenase